MNESRGTSADRDARRLTIALAWTVALAGVLLVVALEVPDLREVLHRVTDAGPGWIIVGVALEVASCLGYVATVRLVLPSAPRREMRRLAWAEMAFGAVVPAGGAGGLAVGAWALRSWGLPWARIVDRSAAMMLLTSAANGVVLSLAGIGVWLGIGGRRSGAVYGLVPAAVGIVAIALFLLIARRESYSGAGRLAPALESTSRVVRQCWSLARRSGWKLLGTLGYIVFDVAVLWVCLRSVGVGAPVLAVVVAYQIGMLANFIPVPGGLGVLESGLLGALILYGMPAGRTAAAIVLYHAIALAVPALGGTVGFVQLRAAVCPRRRSAATRDWLAGLPGLPAAVGPASIVPVAEAAAS